jgi:THAP4-like, heme-binding beta-barrel domain
MRTQMLKLLFVVLFVSASVSAQTAPKNDLWKPLRLLVGVWEGTGKSGSGDSIVEREYKFMLNDRFLQAAQRSNYAAKARNPKEAVHEDVGFFSYDKARKQFVFRQFNSEGFIIQFLVSSISDDGRTMILDSEINENIPKDMRSRITYRISNETEFTETYDIAEPGKDFVTYFTKDFRRKKP